MSDHTRVETLDPADEFAALATRALLHGRHPWRATRTAVFLGLFGRAVPA